MAKITSRDVAREAGVSQTTVSFVMNKRQQHRISDSTRRLVEEAADRLGYVPSAAGKSLKEGRSRVVLCVVPDFPVAEAMEFFKLQLSNSLAEAGYACVVSHYAESRQPFSELWRHVQPAAVVAISALSGADADALDRAGIPLIDGVYGPEGHSFTALSQDEIGRMQVAHLFAKGHHRIGYGTIGDPREYPFTMPRRRGVAEACSEFGLPDPVVVDMEYSHESAREAVSMWTTVEDCGPVTAVALFNDLLALSTLATCRSMGIGVPDRLALIGVDDLAVSSLAVPALSTIALNHSLTAHSLAERVLELIGDNEAAAAVKPVGGQPLRLIVRDST
ncbi:LacI family transcriptional regulator [Rhodococcus sp. 06-621-2]|nr:LacI family DNA-binding transcriptional regulator [Rhodococcus sp. 06-621-2]OZC55542.1 LacI family transcriptional regulator [Rhodococcus sp. 06-621-2]